MATNEATAIITVRVPESMRDQIDALAAATERSRQYHALEAVRRYLATEAWQIEVITERIKQRDTGDESVYATTQNVDDVFNRYRAYRRESGE